MGESVISIYKLMRTFAEYKLKIDGQCLQSFTITHSVSFYHPVYVQK